MSDSEQENEPLSPIKAGDSEEAVVRKITAHFTALQKEYEKRIMHFIALDGHPFEVVEGKGFIEMMSHCSPFDLKYPYITDEDEDLEPSSPLSTLLPPSDSEETGHSEDAEEQRFWKSIARFVIIDGNLIQIVKGDGFKQLMSFCYPKFKLPTVRALARICYRLYLDEKVKLKELMKTNCQSVCLTTDTWNSPQGITYMGITAHFIDEEWKLQRKVLSFLPCPLDMSDEIGEEIENCLVEWGIKKVVTISMDETSSNDDAIVYMKEKLIERGIEFSGCKYLQMKCFVHLINSVVVEALEKAEISVNRVRRVVSYVKWGNRREKKFKKCAEAEKIESTDRLFLDVDHMWNSTYVMLSRAEKYEKAFYSYEKLAPKLKLAMEDGLPSSVDWSIVRKLAVLLRPFYNVMMKISESSHVTSNNYWVDISDLYAIFSEWQKGDDLELQDMAKNVILKLEELFGGYEKMNKMVFIATVLDPRSKFEVLEYAFAQIYGKEKGDVFLENVKEAIFELFDEYKANSGSNEVLNEDPSEKNHNLFMDSYKKQRLGSGDQITELEMYLNRPIEEDKEGFDILEWWKCNSDKFPILAHMARDILAIPKSAVRPDYAFNTEGPMFDEIKGYMDHRILQALICAQDWLRESPPYADIVKEFELSETLDDEIVADFGSSWGGRSDND